MKRERCDRHTIFETAADSSRWRVAAAAATVLAVASIGAVVVVPSKISKMDHGAPRSLFVNSTDRVWLQQKARRRLSQTREPLDPESRIISGTEVDPNRYGFAVGLYFSDNAFVCGGALILPDVVLTAAHCTNFTTMVRTGIHNKWSTEGNEGGPADAGLVQQFNVVEMLIHPLYGEGASSNNDFALLKLDGLSTAPLALLNDQHGAGGTSLEADVPPGQTVLPEDGTTASVLGWGNVDEEGRESPSDVLLEAKVDTMSNQECRNFYQTYPITDAMLCALHDGSGGDACQGDSGGPLIVPDPEGEVSADLLIGVVSWGVGCGGPFSPGVYSRISYGYDWIKNSACALSAEDECNVRLYSQIQAQPVQGVEGPTSDVEGFDSSPSLDDDPDTSSPTTAAPSSSSPSPSPTSTPSFRPTPGPSSAPSGAPNPVTSGPTESPAPSGGPSQGPSGVPSSLPSNVPSGSPSISMAPSRSPTKAPTGSPTPSPSASPSAAPTSIFSTMDYLEKECRDNDFKFVGRNGHERNCKWVEALPNERCEHFCGDCPVTCLDTCVAGSVNREETCIRRYNVWEMAVQAPDN